MEGEVNTAGAESWRCAESFRMRDTNYVTVRRILSLSFLAVGLAFAQAAWQTVTELPGVDWQGLTGAKRLPVLQAIRAEGCGCGCGMKVAECRVLDPACGVSKKLANLAVKDALAGKTLPEIRAELKRRATEPASVLEDPVTIPVVGAPTKGPANARVTVVEYSDFQCPFCSKAIKTVDALLAKYPKDVRVVYKQFPLDQHAQAQIAAEGSLAAHAQGKFWQLHDKMYSDISDLSKERLLVYAKQIGVDVTKFQADLNSRKWEKEVNREREEGETFGVNSTPTFFINGKKYNGAWEVAALAPIIEKELK